MAEGNNDKGASNRADLSTTLEFALWQAEVEVLLVSDIKLLLEVLEASEVLTSLKVSGSTGVDGLGVAIILLVSVVSVVTAVVSNMAVVTVMVSIMTMGSMVVANTVTTVRVGGYIASLLPGGSDGNESSSSESLEHFEITIVFW